MSPSSEEKRKTLIQTKSLRCFYSDIETIEASYGRNQIQNVTLSFLFPKIFFKEDCSSQNANRTADKPILNNYFDVRRLDRERDNIKPKSTTRPSNVPQKYCCHSNCDRRSYRCRCARFFDAVFILNGRRLYV